MRLAIDSEIKSSGQALQALLDNIQREDVEPFIEKHNLKNIDPNQWYYLYNTLKLLYDIGAEPGGMGNLVAIGMSIANTMVLPPELEHAPLSTILELWGEIYQMQHQGGKPGGIKTEKLSEKHYRTTHTVVYPDDLSWGVAYGMAKRFLPSGTHFKVFYLPGEPRLDEGGDHTIIDVEWE